MPSWPASIPNAQFMPITAQPVENRIVTPMDDNTVKVRRRTTREVERFTVACYLTGAQLETFRAFYRDDLKGGALSFDWEDPTTDAIVQLRFQPRQSPPWQFSMLVSAVDPADRRYEGVLHLEHA